MGDDFWKTSEFSWADEADEESDEAQSPVTPKGFAREDSEPHWRRDNHDHNDRRENFHPHHDGHPGAGRGGRGGRGGHRNNQTRERTPPHARNHGGGHHQDRGQQQKMCREFEKTGRCSKGLDCNDLHMKERPPSATGGRGRDSNHNHNHSHNHSHNHNHNHSHDHNHNRRGEDSWRGGGGHRGGDNHRGDSRGGHRGDHHHRGGDGRGDHQHRGGDGRGDHRGDHSHGRQHRTHPESPQGPPKERKKLNDEETRRGIGKLLTQSLSAANRSVQQQPQHNQPKPSQDRHPSHQQPKSQGQQLPKNQSQPQQPHHSKGGTNSKHTSPQMGGKAGPHDKQRTSPLMKGAGEPKGKTPVQQEAPLGLLIKVGPGGSRVVESQTPEKGGQQQRGGNQQQQQQSSKGICFEFAETGKCTRGLNCHFEHKRVQSAKPHDGGGGGGGHKGKDGDGGVKKGSNRKDSGKKDDDKHKHPFDDHPLDKPRGSNKAKPVNSLVPRPGDPDKPCYEFSHTGRCTKGLSCPFDHPQIKSADAPAPKESHRSGEAKTPSPAKPTEEKKTTPSQPFAFKLPENYTPPQWKQKLEKSTDGEETKKIEEGWETFPEGYGKEEEGHGAARVLTDIYTKEMTKFDQKKLFEEASAMLESSRDGVADDHNNAMIAKFRKLCKSLVGSEDLRFGAEANIGAAKASLKGLHFQQYLVCQSTLLNSILPELERTGQLTEEDTVLWSQMRGLFILFFSCYAPDPLEIKSFLPKLPPTVLDTAPIRAALRAREALEMGNHEAFFKCLEASEGMERTILSRAVPKVREKTMATAKSAFRPLTEEHSQRLLRLPQVTP